MELGELKMKLIQILALTAAMATMATAQNAGGNPQAGKAAATPTPAKTAATPAVKTGAPVSAQGAQTGATKGAPAKANATPAPAGKPAAGAPAGKSASVPAPATPAQGATKGATKGGAPNTGKTGTPVAVTKPSPVPMATAKTKGGKKPAMVAVPKTKKSTKGSAVAGKKPKTVKPKIAEVVPPDKGDKKKPVQQRLIGSNGRRDPFVSPIRINVGVQGPGSGCSAGKRCLAIPELVLRGTVRDISGKMLAVVANSAQKTYTLRENDQVFNGSVEKITSDSIIFREFVKDALGRETAREVVKKLGPAS